jgi:type I restriction enzyme S subunit
MVPEGWDRKSFRELFDFKNGYNTEKSDYGSGTPFINVSEVLKNEALYVDDIPGQVRVAEAQISAFGVQRGDILFNRTSETTDEVGFTAVYLGSVAQILSGIHLVNPA